MLVAMVTQEAPPADERAGQVLRLQQEIRALQETHKEIFALAVDKILEETNSNGVV